MTISTHTDTAKRDTLRTRGESTDFEPSWRRSIEGVTRTVRRRNDRSESLDGFAEYLAGNPGVLTMKPDLDPDAADPEVDPEIAKAAEIAALLDHFNVTTFAELAALASTVRADRISATHYDGCYDPDLPGWGDGLPEWGELHTYSIHPLHRKDQHHERIG